MWSVGVETGLDLAGLCPVSVTGFVFCSMSQTPHETPPTVDLAPVAPAAPLADWHEYCRLYCKARTASEYRLAVDRVVKLMAWPGTAAATITEKDLRLWISARTAEGVSAKTVNNEWSAVKHWIGWAVTTGQRTDNPAEKTAVPKSTGRTTANTMRPFLPEEVVKIVAAARREEMDPHTRCRWTDDNTPVYRSHLYEFMAWTGLRQSEACGPRGIRWREVDLKGAKILLEAQTTKMGREGGIPLLPQVVESLTQWRLMNPGARPADQVFPRFIRGAQLDADMKRAGVEKIDPERGQPACFHSFRHGLGRLLAVHNVAPVTAGLIMRHSNPKFTAMVYAQHMHDDQRNALKVLHSHGEAEAAQVIHQGAKQGEKILKSLDNPSDCCIVNKPAEAISSVTGLEMVVTGSSPVAATSISANVADRHRLAERLISVSASLMEEVKRLLAP